MHGNYNYQKGVSNAHYMANKLITNGYKGKSKNSWYGYLMSFMSIRKLMGLIIRTDCLFDINHTVSSQSHIIITQ